MSYPRINWKNDATTPLNADNLNAMDKALFEVANTLKVVVDTVNGNDTTGAFNDETLPFLSLDTVLDRLPTGQVVEIFLAAPTTTVSGAHRIAGSDVIIMSNGTGAPASDSKKLTFLNNSDINIFGGGFLNLFIDTTFEGTNSIRVSNNSGVALFDHRLHVFSDSPVNDTYVPNGRTSAMTMSITQPFNFFGVNSMLAIASTNILDSTLGANPELFRVAVGCTASVRFDVATTQFNTVAANSANATKSFRGLLANALPMVYNVQASYDIVTTDII